MRIEKFAKYLAAEAHAHAELNVQMGGKVDE